VTTPLGVADAVASGRMAEMGLVAADDFDEHALLEASLAAALASVRDLPYRDLAERPGFRTALHGTVKALRLAGIAADSVRSARLEDGARGRLLWEVLGRYEEGLEAAGLADEAARLALAGEMLDRHAALPAEEVLLLPGHGRRGLRGRLLELLLDGGASVLESDPVVGLRCPTSVMMGPASEAVSRLAFLHEPKRAAAAAEPEVTLFAAANPDEELREVLRRVRAAGDRWDQVEIVATDPVSYGSALDALATRLGIPATYAVGLPVGRTRQGQAVLAYLRWIESDFPADVPWALLRAETLTATASETDEPPGGGRLARRLRALRIGWGRDRYESAIEGALRHLDETPAAGRVAADDEDDRDPEEIGRDQSDARSELVHLRALLVPLLRATPPTPDRTGRGGTPVSAADVARGALAFLEHVYLPEPTGPGATEHEARERLVAILDRIRDTQDMPTSFAMAVTAVRDWLEDVRVPSPGSPGPRPWSSSEGKLHLTDVEHGGLSGRPVTFVVGLDAGRFPGSGLQDSILPDEDRQRLGGEVLPTARAGLDERRYRFAVMLAGLRGRVTLSYSAWESAEGRTIAPASVMLQAARIQQGDASLDYRGMHRVLGAPASPVPRSGGLLDDADVWLDALASDGSLRAGRKTVLEAYPALAAGLEADRRRESAGAGPHRGVVSPRPDRFDPRGGGEPIVSASRLETLGRCPLAYLYRYVLGLRAPEDPELDPSRWLDARDRGALLHRVFELVLARASERDVAPGDERFSLLAREVLDDVAGRVRDRLPPPGDFVYEREVEGLRADVDVFVAMVREEEPESIARELEFGFPGSEHPAVHLGLPGGPIRIRGRIDRVDRVRPFGLRVVDYKTGSDRGRDADPFEGGRRWQHLLYTEATTVLLDERVVRMEYRYPTVRGQNGRVPYLADELAGGPDRLDALLEGVARGNFVPTSEARDCRFCAFKAICRVREDQWGNVDSPPARWASEHGEGLPEFEQLARARRSDE